MTRWRFAAWATTLLAAVTLYEAGVVATHHLESPDWTPHARFHAMAGWFHLAALAIVALVLAWGPLRDGSRGVRFALSILLLPLPGAPLAAWALLPPGGPPPLDAGLAAAGTLIASGVAVLLA